MEFRWKNLLRNLFSPSFDPAGFVEHPNIKSTTSIVDFIFRVLGYEYLGRTDLVHVLDKPEVLNTGTDDWDDVPSGLGVCQCA